VDRAGFGRLAELPLERQGAMSHEAWNRRVLRGDGPRGGTVRTPPGWALLLKGSEWWGQQGGAGAVHRSPDDAGRRVLLQVDYADYVEQPPAPQVPGGAAAASATSARPDLHAPMASASAAAAALLAAAAAVGVLLAPKQ